ncbi:MAG: PAS domain S-box protein [Candidatus Aminicenantes bacterium]|nr:PAS domain S-box protein [Candidatus Aminicenantes bacterium]
MLIFVFLAVVIITAGFLFYRNYKLQFRSETESQLTAIVGQKVSDLANWRRGRLNDALLFFHNGVFSVLVRRYFENPADLKAQIEIRTWLSHLRTARQYDRLMLLDNSFFKKISIPAVEERSVSFVSPSSAADLRAGKVAFEDFYWNESTKKIYIKILIPVLEGYNGNLPKATLAMRIDPNDYLYPLIQRWPTPSRTAETLLVRREGSDILYLNELRFQKNAALKLRIPLSDKNNPAVMAVLGREGIVEGRDYRGMPVIAVLRAIPDSPWFLEARIDRAEVFAPLKDRLRMIIILVFVLLLGAGAGLALLWRQQEARFFRDKYKATETLRESEERFKFIFDNSVDGMLLINLENQKINNANISMSQMLGYSLEELQKLGAADIHPKEDMPYVEKQIEMQATDGLAPARDLPMRRKDGSVFYANVRGAPIMLSGKKYLLGVFRDITERKRVESALRESEERFRVLSASAQDAILMMDDQGRLTYWNPAAERIFGHISNEAIGHNLHDLIAPQRYHQALHAAFPEFQRSGQGAAVGKTLELQGLCKDGREITVALSLSAVQIKGSWHAVGILRDISKQKTAEKELYNLLDELEQANNRLEAANQRANQLAVESQAANIAKGQFLANMSHEIRTPMNGVIGMTELLLGTDLSAEQRRFAETVRLSGEALLSVINDILDFSKIEADKLELETIDFDLRATFEDAAELLALRAHEKNLEFVCRVDPEVHTFLKGDPGRLRQILINLGSNAIKFTARGEIFIEVRLESESMERIKLRVEVRDTGIGIPADKIGLLFSAFQQVDASTTRRFGGTGLGLAISKRLVEAMGGEIGIESVEGRGSTFWFTAVFGKQPQRDRGTGTGQAKISGVRILVVDDNATNRLVLSEQLASWEVRHTEAASAAQALDMLRKARAQNDPFRIVIADMQMPEMDGESLGKSIKADPKLRDTLLVLMTSFGRRGDAKRLEAIGFSAYLTKPVKQSQLYDCLATIIGAVAPEAGTAEAALVTRHTISEARRLKVRILLVEDNLTNQQVALGILEKLGFHSDAVSNGREAIQALETVAYDLVFMDVQMPVMDGFEATAAIRSGQTTIPNSKIPIIAMTAHAMKGDRERCLEAGMDDYIPKPIAPQAMAAVLDKWLDQSLKVPAAVPAAPSAPLVFDRRAFVDRLSGDLDLVKEITDAFLQDMPEQIHMLKRHIGRGNVKAAGLQAHAIKGAAANVGGLALSVTAMALEKAAQAKRLDEVTALLSELERQFHLLQALMLENGQ